MTKKNLLPVLGVLLTGLVLNSSFANPNLYSNSFGVSEVTSSSVPTPGVSKPQTDLIVLPNPELAIKVYEFIESLLGNDKSDDDKGKD